MTHSLHASHCPSTCGHGPCWWLDDTRIAVGATKRTYREREREREGDREREREVEININQPHCFWIFSSFAFANKIVRDVFHRVFHHQAHVKQWKCRCIICEGSKLAHAICWITGSTSSQPRSGSSTGLLNYNRTKWFSSESGACKNSNLLQFDVLYINYISRIGPIYFKIQKYLKGCKLSFKLL